MIGIPAQGVPYDFQDLIGLQSAVSTQATDFNCTTDFVTFRRFHIEEKILDPTIIESQANAKFMGHITSGTYKGIKINDEWCLVMFGGTGKSNMVGDVRELYWKNNVFGNVWELDPKI